MNALQQRLKGIVLANPDKLNRDYYYSHKALWQCRDILFCPAQETAYKLDPNDPRDRKLIEHYRKLIEHYEKVK